MGLKAFSVVIRPRQPVYFPAQKIEGVVRITVSSTVEFRGMRLRCGGKCLVYWTEKRGKTTKIYRAKELYGEKEVNVSPRQGNLSTFEAGDREIPFSFILPAEAPSSFEGTHGYIRYRVDAKLKIARSFDKKAEAFFSFCQPYDLNLDYRAKEPLAFRSEHSWGKSLFKHGPVTFELGAPSKATVPGSTIHLRGSARNDGDSSVDIKVSLKQKLVYQVKSKTKLENRVMCSAKFTCQARSSMELTGLDFKIPAVVPHLQFCQSIRLEYVLQIKTGSTMSKSVKTETPFFLGTLPLVKEEDMADSMYGSSGSQKEVATTSSPAVSVCYFSGERKISRDSHLKMKGGPPNYVVAGPN